MPSLLPTPEPADPVEGQPGHFEHSNWLKASVKALDSGVVHKAGDTMTGPLVMNKSDSRINLTSEKYGNGSVDSLRVGAGNTPDSVLAPVMVAKPAGPYHATTKEYVDKRTFGVDENIGIHLRPGPLVTDATSNLAIDLSCGVFSQLLAVLWVSVGTQAMYQVSITNGTAATAGLYVVGADGQPVPNLAQTPGVFIVIGTYAP